MKRFFFLITVFFMVACGKFDRWVPEENGIFVEEACVLPLNSAFCSGRSTSSGVYYCLHLYAEDYSLLPSKFADVYLSGLYTNMNYMISRWLDGFEEGADFVEKGSAKVDVVKVEDDRLKLIIRGSLRNGKAFCIFYDGELCSGGDIY